MSSAIVTLDLRCFGSVRHISPAIFVTRVGGSTDPDGNLLKYLTKHDRTRLFGPPATNHESNDLPEIIVWLIIGTLIWYISVWRSRKRKREAKRVHE